jgi:hypothetical protein
MNLTISLDEQVAAQLQQEASARGLSAEQVASDLLGRALSKIAQEAACQATVAQMPETDPVAMNKLFDENREKVPAEKLAACAGQYVAWWPDGSRIFAADADYHALRRRLRQTGYPERFFRLERIPLPGEPAIDPYVALAMRWSENRNNFPAEELWKYSGKVVAWWLDGSRIVDSDTDGDALLQRLRQTGHDLSYIRFEPIPYPDESFV